MNRRGEGPKPGQRKLQNWKALSVIAILTAAALVLAGAVAISGTSYYLESIAHLDALGKLKRTGLVVFIIVLSVLITFGMDRGREASRTGLPAGENEITTKENRTEAQGRAKRRAYAGGGPVRRLCCLGAVILAANIALWPFWDDIKLSGALLANALILLLYGMLAEEITRRSRKNQRSPGQLPE